jgi:hypothetical protein
MKSINIASNSKRTTRICFNFDKTFSPHGLPTTAGTTRRSIDEGGKRVCLIRDTLVFDPKSDEQDDQSG